jgi:hypothetical protein
MKAKSNLSLRRVKNRKRFKRMAITGILSIPSSISDSAMLSLKKAWQNQYQGFSTEPAGIYLTDEEENNILKVYGDTII